jgi:hypothetical protein
MENLPVTFEEHWRTSLPFWKLLDQGAEQKIHLIFLQKSGSGHSKSRHMRNTDSKHEGGTERDGVRLMFMYNYYLLLYGVIMLIDLQISAPYFYVFMCIVQVCVAWLCPHRPEKTCPPFLLLRQCYSLAWDLPRKPGYLASNTQGSSSRCPSTEITVMFYYIHSAFHMALGPHTQETRTLSPEASPLWVLIS